MAALRDYPSAPPDPAPAVIAARPSSRLRLAIAVLLLTAMGLLAAASVLASRPYQPQPKNETRRSTSPHAPGPDRC